MNKKRLCILIAILLSFALVSCEFFPALPSSEESSEENISPEILDKLTVRFLDIGQGDSILLEFSDGKFMLIDAGVYTNKKAVLNNLDKYGVKELEYMVLTHFDADHIGAAAEVINGYTVKNVIMPDSAATTKTFDNLLTALENHEEVKVIKGEAGLKFEVNGAKFEVISPFDTHGKTANETSVVILMTYSDIKMLFMGDAEVENEEEILNRYTSGYIKADLIKIGHHGSATSSSRVFLQAVSPKYAVISCGRDNQYKHPHQVTLDSLADLNITCYRTDLQGTITVNTDGVDLTISVEY